jgi:outer membrane protein TolC
VIQTGQVVVAPEPNAPAPATVRDLVVGLDTVFRLVQEQNATIAQKRAAVAEAEASANVAASSCVPNFLRSEANRPAAAEAKLLQQRAELARTTHEVLQEAGTAYYDWLTARRGAAVARGLLAKEEKLLTRARAYAKEEQPAKVLVANIEAIVAGRKQSQQKFHQQALAAAVRLAYLLNISEKVLVPADSDLNVVDLVPLDTPVEVLVQQVRAMGPGMPELLSLETVVEKAIAESHCLERGCNLTGKTAFCGRLQAAHAKLDQVRLARIDLAGKLEAGVREAYAAIQVGQHELASSRQQVGHAVEANRLANVWLEDSVSVQTLAEVLQSIRGLESAHYGYLQAVSAYDKAQLRLHVVLILSAAK